MLGTFSNSDGNVDPNAQYREKYYQAKSVAQLLAAARERAARLPTATTPPSPPSPVATARATTPTADPSHVLLDVSSSSSSRPATPPTPRA